MIIKSLSRKEPSFAQLTAYMLDDERAQVAILHNLAIGANTPEEIVRDFEENHALLPGRVNGNALFHEIVALPPLTGVPVKEQARALREIAEHYLELRAPQQLALGVIHTSTAHVHIHLMISSNALLSRGRVWLTKRDFAEIQRDVEAYRLEHFPELGRARHYDRPGLGVKRSAREQAVKVRTGGPSHKEQLAVTLKAVLRDARNPAALEQAVAELGLTLYRRGRSVGVQTEGGRRYRFSTLGLAEAYAEALSRIELAESRMASLKRGRVRRTPERERES